MTLYALSLHRPMDVALVDARIRKDIENREWTEDRHQALRTRLERVAVGQWLAVQSAQTYHQAYRRFVMDLTGIDVPPEDTHPGHVIGLIKIRRTLLWSPSKWFADDGRHLGLEVADRIQLPRPVHQPGRQGLFLLPTLTEDKVRAQCAAMGRAL